MRYKNNQSALNRKTNTMKKTLLTIIALIAASFTAGAQQVTYSHTVPTNFTVDATNRVYTIPYSYNGIWICNDSDTNMYAIVDKTFSLVTTTNVLQGYNSFPTNRIQGNVAYYPTNFIQTNSAISVIVSNTINPLVAGQGTRLNAGGGAVFFDASGKPTSAYLSIITQGGNGKNASVGIGITQ